jgi:hypothetical protein
MHVRIQSAALLLVALVLNALDLDLSIQDSYGLPDNEG